VRYFGPGIHRPGEIRLKSNETLYLAGGAIVKGAVIAEDAENIRILGRGILDGIDWEWRAGPAGSMIKLRRCSSVVISGITLRSSWGWTIVLAGCDHVKVSNVKICNGRVMNDDGINPVNSQHVTIEDCFIRSDDDCIAMKGMGYGKRNVEDIRVQNCVLWCDRARIFLLGHESRAEFMRNITVRDCDIIHYGFTPFLVEPGEEMTIEDILFEDIRVNCERPSEGPPRGPFGLIRLNPTINQYMKDKTPGRIRRLHFRDITVSGDGAESASIHLGGYDEQHMVENVTFENVTRNGEPVREDSPRITIDRKHVRNIRFISEGE
jgi:polygalacturonase